MHFSMLNECRNLLTIFLRWFETKIIQKKKSTFGFGWKRKRVGEGNSEMEVGFLIYEFCQKCQLSVVGIKR